MRIALLTEIISGRSGARAPLEIAKALKKNGVDVTVFGYQKLLEQESISELNSAGIAVTAIDQPRMLAPYTIARLLIKGSFDIVSFHGTLPFFLGALFTKIPIVRTYYGTHNNTLIDNVYNGKPGLRLRLLNILSSRIILRREKFMSRHSIRVIAISKCMKNEHRRLYGNTPSVIYLGNISSQQRIITKSKQKEIISIISVSRIVPYKGFHTLIRIFDNLSKKYQKIELIIAGSTPNQQYLTYLKKIAGKNIRFNTNITDKQLQECYQAADIYATFDQSLVFSMTILEAGIFSLPSVALNICSAKEEILHGKTGYLAGNQKQFEIYLERLILDKDLRRSMGEQAKVYVHQFSWDNLAKQYIQQFKNIWQ